MPLVLAILTTTTGGEAHVDAVGGTIAVAGKARAVHQGFNEPGAEAVGAFPVLRSGAQEQRQHMAGEMRNAHPGESQKATVVDDSVEAVMSCCRAANTTSHLHSHFV